MSISLYSKWKTRSAWERFHQFSHPNFKKLSRPLWGVLSELFTSFDMYLHCNEQGQGWNSIWRAITHLGLFVPSKVAKISTTASKGHPVVAQAMTKNSYPPSRRSWHKEADTSQVQIGNLQLEEVAICLLPTSRLVENPSLHLP